jgi:hypothetical protein
MTGAQADFSFVPDVECLAAFFSPEVEPVEPLEPLSAASLASELFPPEGSSLLEEPPSEGLALLRRESVA